MLRTCLCAASLLLLTLSGCATTATNPADPWESVNRKVYAVNDSLDRYALRPVAQGYKTVVPLPLRTNVSNFFGNIEDVWTGLNNLLQGKPREGASDFGRVAINSTIGILGLFDVATDIGLEKHEEDLGQTLGVWGMGPGPYVMLPLLGPSTVRDAGGSVPRYLLDPSSEISRIPLRNSVTALKLVNARAQLIGADSALDEAALDRYGYLRDFYLKSRQSQIFDGHPPREKDDYYE
ncbi:VacJ family lipoprotein [Uliginosibacterium paludis]|uniref:VacJ family lipoprotein n=1 Tax=Uliginosibacterium paludis TaxID=1615952 RepID=A0ABV2CRE1_9RHOO